jgi:DNA-binding winged helix-turn-helix (wHTH) protein
MMWRLHLLGETQVIYDERVYKDIAPQEALLLGGLALAPKRSLSRSELMALLWDDEDYSEYLASRLRQTLYNLKTKLKKQFGSDSLLSTSKETVSLAPDVVIDVIEFEAAIAASKKAADLTSIEAHLTKAIQLYSGKLLPQHPYRLDEKRERLAEDYCEAQKQLEELPVPPPIASPPNPSSAPSATPHPSAAPRHKRSRLTALMLLCLGVLAYMVWVITRREVQVTVANAPSIIEEMKKLRLGGSVMESPAEREARLKRHAELCIALVEAADKRIWGAEENFWQGFLEQTSDSQRTAFEWCLEHDSEKALQLSSALAPYWMRKAITSSDPTRRASIQAEGRRWLDAALERAPNSRTPSKARAMRRYVMLAFEFKPLSQSGQLIQYAEKSLQLCREHQLIKEEAEAHRMLGFALAANGAFSKAYEQYRQVQRIYHQQADQLGEAQTLINLAHLGWAPPGHVYGAWNAEQAKGGLLRFRKLQCDYGIQRALSVYESSVSSITPNFAEERRVWQGRLLEEYRIEAQNQERLPNFAPANSYRYKYLQLASTLCRNDVIRKEIIWHYRYWRLRTPSLSRKTWAKLHGIITALNVKKDEGLSDEEIHIMQANIEGYQFEPKEIAAYHEGKKMSLTEAAAFVLGLSSS